MTDPRIEALRDGRLHDPNGYLGRHREACQWVVRHFDPHARAAWLRGEGDPRPMRDLGDGVFEWRGDDPPREAPAVEVLRGDTRTQVVSPWSFAPEIGSQDCHLFNEGRLTQAWRVLGAHCRTRGGASGVRFACWAPNAERVSVVGDFNGWDGRCHPMQVHGGSGLWELFVPGLGPGTLYKFEIRHRDSGAVLLKTDPYGQAFELRPGTAARVTAPPAHAWGDAAWMQGRATRDWLRAPLNIYEVHAGSWKRHPGGRFWNWGELAEDLVAYALDMGFTHLELLPVTEHPLDESWGYQCTGYFAPTGRHGSPDDFRAFVDRCHQAGLGVILDWVPAHFPQDDWALARFDGTALYEHQDPRLGLHADWGTHVFNFGRNEVRSFLLSSAAFWLSEFHVDGLRVDAVASMLYLDYSRREGAWLPNRHGGRENLEAIDFLRELNTLVHRDFPGALTLAEESTAWPMVSRPAYLGGLGFSLKWNMGWMNDTLAYMSHDPVHRRFHHDRLTFGQLYAYSENFLLPLSHDEVVHGKRSLLDKMPGDTWQKFANLRLLLALQAVSPGRKLLFMGGEFGQGREWRAGGELDWGLLGTDWHAGVQRCTRDLMRLVRDHPALHELDFEPAGFAWIDCHDAEQSVIALLRRARGGRFVLAVLNFTPVPRPGYRIGVPQGGFYGELFNSDSRHYRGADVGNAAGVHAERLAWMGQPFSAVLTLPPLGALILEPSR